MSPTAMQIAKSKSLAHDLEHAVNRLKEALQLEPTRIHKDATIQRFEFCFELGWKLLQAINTYKGMSAYGPRENIRVAARTSIIEDPEMWMSLLDARSITTHIYKEAMSDKVYTQTKELVPLTEGLLKKVEKMLKDEQENSALESHTDS